MSTQEAIPSVTACRLEPVDGRDDPDHVLEPGVYLFLFSDCEDDDPEGVVGLLVTKPTPQWNIGLCLDVQSKAMAEEMGVYMRKFDGFGDMAGTLLQGLEALGEVGRE